MTTASTRPAVSGQAGETWSVNQAAVTDYLFNGGGDAFVSPDYQVPGLRGPFGFETNVQFAAITDGLSSTFLLGEALGGSDRVALSAFIDSVDRWVGERLRADDANANANLARLARLAEVWEKINSAARDTESYNLERKPLVFSVFGLLAEAMQ